MKHSGEGCETSDTSREKPSWLSIATLRETRIVFQSLVAELVQLKVDVLVATAPPVIREAKQASKTIPIVMVTTQDPVATGVVDS